MFKTVSCKEFSGSGAASICNKIRLSAAAVNFDKQFNKAEAVFYKPV
jgi:hypothetical protein